jgi:hypothetical protein
MHPASLLPPVWDFKWNVLALGCRFPNFRFLLFAFQHFFKQLPTTGVQTYPAQASPAQCSPYIART